MNYAEWSNNRELIGLWNEEWQKPHMKIALEVIKEFARPGREQLSPTSDQRIIELYAINYARVEGSARLLDFVTTTMGTMPRELPQDNRPLDARHFGEATLLDENDPALLEQIINAQKTQE